MYIRCCIWYNTWRWTYSLNWELVTMIFFSGDSSYLYVWVNHIFVTVNSDDMSKMETVSYTTDYFQSLPCFKWKLRKTWFLLKRMDCNESWKSLSPQLLFRVSLSRFHFISALQHLHNRYAVKQTSSLYLKLSLVPPFFSCFLLLLLLLFLLFGKVSRVKLIYSWISKQKFPTGGDEGGIFLKLHTENLCFCVR